MVLSRFFQRQQSEKNDNKDGGLGGADVLDDVRPDPRQPQSASNDNVTDLFRKKKTPIIASKNKAALDDHSSEDSDDNSNDNQSNENYDDEATFVTKDSDIKSIDRQTLPLRSGDNDDDVTVDTMTTIDVKSQIKNDFLNDFSGNKSTSARPKRRSQMHSDATSNNDSSSSSNSNEDEEDSNNVNDINNDTVDSDTKQAATLPLPKENTTTTTTSVSKSKLQSAGKKASWSTAWFSSTASSTAATKIKNNTDTTTPSAKDTSSTPAVNEDEDEEADSEILQENNNDEPNCPSLMVGKSNTEEEDCDDATNHNAAKGAIKKVLLPVAATAALAASTIAEPVAKKSGWGWKALSSSSSSTTTATKTTSDVVATTTNNDIISDGATDRSCDNSVDVTELEQLPNSSLDATTAKNLPLSSSTHSQRAGRSTTAAAIPIFSLFASKRSTTKASSDPEQDMAHDECVDKILSNNHGDQEADDVDDNGSDDGSHQDRGDEEADVGDDDSVENVSSHSHGDVEADGVDDDDESSEDGSYQHSVQRDNIAGQNNSESEVESDDENSNDDEGEGSEMVQASRRESNLMLPQPSTAKVVSSCITDDDGKEKGNDNDVDDASKNTTSVLAATINVEPVTKKSGWGWKALSSTVSSTTTTTTTKMTSDVVATTTNNDIISDGATDRSCDNSVDATELEQLPNSSLDATTAKNLPLSSSTHSQRAGRSTTAAAIPILSLFASKRSTTKASSDPEQDMAHDECVDKILSNNHGDQEADDVDDNSSDDGSHQDRGDEEADVDDDDSVENVSSHSHGDVEADGVDDDDESSENGSYQHSVQRDNIAGQNNSESEVESDDESSNDDESEGSEMVQASRRESNLMLPQPSTAKVVSSCITDDDGKEKGNDNDVDDANKNTASALAATINVEPVTKKSGWGWKALSSTISSTASTEKRSDLGVTAACNGIVADGAAHSRCDESVEDTKSDQDLVSSNDIASVEMSSSSHSQKPIAFTASAAIPIFSLLTSKRKSTAKPSSDQDDDDVVDNVASDYIGDAESEDDSGGSVDDGSQQDSVEHENTVSQNGTESEDFSADNTTNSDDESETSKRLSGIQRSHDFVAPLPSTATADTSVAADRDEEENDNDDASDEDCDRSNENLTYDRDISSRTSDENFDDENDHDTGCAGDMDDSSSGTSESEGDNWQVEHSKFSIAKSVAVEITENQFQHHTVPSIDDFSRNEQVEKRHDENNENSDISESFSDGSDGSVHNNVNRPSNKREDEWNAVHDARIETDNVGSSHKESQNRNELLLDDKSSTLEHHAVAESDRNDYNPHDSEIQETKMSNTLKPNDNEMEDITARRYSPSDVSERSSDSRSCAKPTERLDDELDSSVDSKAKANEAVMESVISEDESNSSSGSDTSMERTKKVLEIWKETVENSSKKGDRATIGSASFSDDDEPTLQGDTRIESNDNHRDGGKAPKRVWGWFAAKKAVQEGKHEKDLKPVDSVIDATLGKRTDDEIESAAPSESIDKEGKNGKVDESESDQRALEANENVPSETSEKVQDQQGQKKGWWFGKKSSFDESQAQVDPLQQKEKLLDGDSSKSSLERSSNHSTESVTEPLLDVLMNLEDTERATKAMVSSSNHSPRPNRKKKKKAKDISTLLEGARKVSRHGDEVSVGTMNVKKRQSGRAVVISRSHDEFDDGDEFGPKSRPWESTLKKIPKRSFKPKSTRQKLPPLDEFNSFPSELEDLLKVDVFSNTDDFLYQGKVSTKADKQLPSLQEDDESDGKDNSDAPRDDEANNSLEEKFGADATGIDTSNDKNDFERQLEAVDQETPQALDFDDMWDNVSCDASIAIEFERVKRKKNHEKEKKRQRREQEKDEKINSAQRLRVFERRSEKEAATNEGSAKKGTDKQSKLSDALVDAIHKVFDDGSVNSAASSQDQSKDEANRLDNRSSNGSCGSLYIPGDDECEKSDNDDDNNEDSVGSGNEVSKQGEGRARLHTSDDVSDDGMTTVPGSKMQENKKRAKDKKHNQGVKVANNKKNKKGKKATKRSEIDSSEMFLAEVERLNRPKVLTIAALKQEMIDRRGTSVNLVKKEYVNYRKKRNDRRKGSTDNELKPIDFGALSEQLKKKQADSPNDIFGKPTANDSRDDSESTSKQHQGGGLGAKLSRWKASEGISELDDLATVMDSTPHHTSLLGSAAAFAKTTISHLPEVAAPVINDVQGMAQTAGKTLATAGTTALSVGHAVGTTAASNVGSGLSHGAQAINSGINTTTEVFGKGLHTVAHGLTSTLTTSEAHNTDSKKESFQGTDMNKHDDNFMFAANFSDDHLMTIQEGDDDDDDDHGLLASHHKNRNHHDTHSFDGGSFYNDDGDDDESRGSGLRENHKRNFKMSSMIKAPKMNLNIKNFVPKLPKRKGSSGNHGYGGM